MERLTTQIEKIRIREDSVRELKKDFSIEELQQHYIEVFDKLQTYEVEEENDMLLHLPCEIGQTLYRVRVRYSRCSIYQETYSCNCNGCNKLNNGCDSEPYVALETIRFGLDNLYEITKFSLGKSVFVDIRDALLKKIELEKELESRE